MAVCDNFVCRGLHGTPSLHLVADAPVPIPGPGQLRVRIHCASLNPVDTKYGWWAAMVDPGLASKPAFVLGKCVDVSMTCTRLGNWDGLACMKLHSRPYWRLVAQSMCCELCAPVGRGGVGLLPVHLPPACEPAPSFPSYKLETCNRQALMELASWMLSGMICTAGT